MSTTKLAQNSYPCGTQMGMASRQISLYTMCDSLSSACGTLNIFFQAGHDIDNSYVSKAVNPEIPVKSVFQRVRNCTQNIPDAGRVDREEATVHGAIWNVSANILLSRLKSDQMNVTKANIQGARPQGSQ